MENKFVEVFVTSGLLEAETFKILLEANDIPVLLSQESAGVVYGLTVGPLGIAKIMVPETMKEEAQKILNDFLNGKLDEDADLTTDDQAAYPQ